MTEVTKLTYLRIDDIHQTELPPGHPVELFLEHWRTLSRDGAVPARRDFSPIDVPALLPYLVVLEVAEDDKGIDLRARLEGEYLVALTGKNHAGYSLRESLGEKGYRLRLREVEDIRQKKDVLLSRIEAVDYQGKSHTLYRGTFPFVLDGSEIDQVFTVIGDCDISLL